ncbi:coiled-coil domain-containing protein 6 [Teleopsis dalmanni]|uniref:coiled-coil domain-containing protein 6 n=1 Tax=Teleopsis dalmanni TaxID=139649 RepID=UPI0018CD228C|nr:coiled-coil domain-containing protein 6 [Teleopsis dalmanni]XP_037939812.1 coiled-coil domain-containing protein 6 [Teleopsis dalmanni]XP_037939813.1 coiled-coil domain-containing protein 6 [Teleopsis dalmanni]XP_037939814.1 coiled-coil domain-containing protein 6 [Teleopsis dalmanni]
MESPCESESSLDGGSMLPPSPVSREQLQKRIESLTQQNKVLKAELDTFKIKCKVVQEENRTLKQASVIIQAKAEQEEEYISNTLLKKIQALKKEKETLAHHYEREEECLTNDLSRKLDQLRQEKCKLEQTLEQEQECLVNKLMRKIEKLQAETDNKQTNLEQLRREMVELENTLEQEQEALVNKLWKRMDKLETEKRSLQIKLDQPVSDPTTPRDITNANGDTASHLTSHVQTLRSEVIRLRANLAAAQKETTIKMQQFAQEEKNIREENRKLKLEVERREALCRHLSESESSLEMDEERFYNESLMAGGNPLVGNTAAAQRHRQRTISSPVSNSPSNSRPLSPGTAQQNRCYACGQIVNRRASERFIKPALPTPMLGLNTSAPNVLGSSTGGPSANLNSNSLFSATTASSGFLSGINSDRLNYGASGAFNSASLLSGGNSSNTTTFNVNASNVLNQTASNPININLNSSSSSSSSIMNTSNSSLSAFTPTNTSSSTSFAQPASPMDTSVYKE